MSSSEMCVPRNLKLDTLHHLLVDIQWCMYILFPPEIVFCFFDVQGQIVLRAPPHQPLYLLSLGRLIASGDQPQYSHIVHEFDKGVGIIRWYTIMCIQRKEKRA